MHFSFTLNLFLSITQYIDARININKKISFDIITLLFERRSNFVQNILYNPKQFQFHSQFQPRSRLQHRHCNILHRQLYVAYTSCPKYFPHPINNTQNISIPSFKPFPNSLPTFLTCTLHVSNTRFHKHPYSVYYLVVAQQLKTMRFLNPTLPHKLKLIPPYHMESNSIHSVFRSTRKPRYPTWWSATWPSIDRGRAKRENREAVGDFRSAQQVSGNSPTPERELAR